MANTSAERSCYHSYPKNISKRNRTQVDKCGGAALHLETSVLKLWVELVDYPGCSLYLQLSIGPCFGIHALVFNFSSEELNRKATGSSKSEEI